MNHDAYERRCRALLRAYPPRYRQSRQDELLGTLLDAAPAERDTPTLRDSWDVIRGGLKFRLHDRPPLHQWLAYRLLNRTLSYRYRWWARDDILGRYYFLRFSWLLIFMSLWGAVSPPELFHGHTIVSTIVSTIMRVAFPVLLVLCFLDRRWGGYRSQMLARYQFNPDGTPWQSPPSPSLSAQPPA